MKFHINSYSLYVDGSLYGFDGNQQLWFQVCWDAPVANPDDPELWERQKRALLSEIEYLVSHGAIPIVAVFVPSDRHYPLSDQEIDNMMNKRFKAIIDENGNECWQGIRLKTPEELANDTAKS